MKYKKVANNKWFLRLDPDDEIHEAIKKIALAENIQAAQISGIGGLEEVEVGVIVPEAKAYVSQTMSNAGNIEVISLLGNLTCKDGEPFAHLHILVTAQDKPLLGGHLIRGVVKVTMEIWLNEISEKMERIEVEDLGFWQIDVV